MPADVVFEDSLADSWSGDLDVAEVGLADRPLSVMGVAIALIGAVIAGQVLFLGVLRHDGYRARAEANLNVVRRTPAPRGIITDRNGTVLAENRGVFAALLDVREFLGNEGAREGTLDLLREALGIPPEEVWRMIADVDLERSAEPIMLAADLDPAQLVALKEKGLSTIVLLDTFVREYPNGRSFAPVLGYVGLITARDAKDRPELTGRDVIGKAGVELFYDDLLRGSPGTTETARDARGRPIGDARTVPPTIGRTLTLTIDAELQSYVYRRMSEGLSSLGRTNGVVIAMDPRNGEVLALYNFPGFDNNVFVVPARRAERASLLSSADRPLFDRATSGLYPPGSTIKPLVGVAALREGVIDPSRIIFSPGYLDVPNPYDPERPYRFLDWRYQGDVDLSAALAQSSNVYFYTVGGGADGIAGLGIDRLRAWWERFGFGARTGVDLPGEEEGFLPSAEWKERTAKRPWFLGDTYNVSIGQGDLLVTPLQLIDYVAAIANGGTLYEPHLNKDLAPKVRADLTDLLPEIREVQKGMREAVTSPLGTAHRMDDLPFSVYGKTGSAQVRNNQEENAFFVGYLPGEAPLVLVVLVENAKEGSLNAVPVAEDIFAWYYENRMR